MKRRLNITIEIPDNDLIQFNLEKLLYNIVGEEKIKDLRVLPNTDHLKDNEVFRKLIKEKRNSRDEVDKFINNNRLCNTTCRTKNT